MSGNIVFDRYYKVTFTDLSEVVSKDINNTTSNLWTFTSDDSKAGRSSFQIQGSVKRTLKASGDSPDNVLNITLVNLPKDIITRLKTAEILRVSLDLGYKNFNREDSGTTPLISNVFSGDVKSFKTTFDGLNYKTTIDAISGITEKTGSSVSISVEPKTSVQSTIKSIVKSFSEVYIEANTDKKIFLSNINTVFDADVLNNVNFSNHRSFEGVTSKVLTELCNEFKVSWSFQGDTVFIYKLSERENKKLYSVINIKKGNVIGGLGATFSTVGTNKKSETQASQVNMKTFLDPRINIESIINLEKDFDEDGIPYSGNYLPSSWTHNFNYRGNNWDTSVEMIRVANKEKT